MLHDYKREKSYLYLKPESIRLIDRLSYKFNIFSFIIDIRFNHLHLKFIKTSFFHHRENSLSPRCLNFEQISRQCSSLENELQLNYHHTIISSVKIYFKYNYTIQILYLIFLSNIIFDCKHIMW
jgi:hypothetical protein